MRKTFIITGAAALAAAAIAVAAPKKKHTPPAPRQGGTVIELCDGETSVEVNGAMTPDKARAASRALMDEWRKKNPGARWDDTLADAGGKLPPAAPAATQKDIYGAYTSRDAFVWAEETRKFVDEGNAIFHDAKKLGGTVAMSCDMCHPNAANTHPETYPKFQVQLGRVALLRDMINWCIENPVKGKPLADDDRRLRALEAYILAQRKGVALDYGKH